MSDLDKQARKKVVAEFTQVEGKLIRVWDIIGYDTDDSVEKQLCRCRIEGGIIVQVRSRQSQNPNDLFRAGNGKIRPRWKVRLAESRQLSIATRHLWVRAPSISIETGDREEKFRYLLC